MTACSCWAPTGGCSWRTPPGTGCAAVRQPGDAGAGAFFFDGGSEATRVSLDEVLVRVAREAV